MSLISNELMAHTVSEGSLLNLILFYRNTVETNKNQNKTDKQTTSQTSLPTKPLRKTQSLSGAHLLVWLWGVFIESYEGKRYELNVEGTIQWI